MKFSFTVAILIILQVSTIWIAHPVYAAPTQKIIVTTTEMVIEDDGQCSLLEAVLSVQSQKPSGQLAGECTAGTEIVLESGQTYTFDNFYEETDQGFNALPVIDFYVSITTDGDIPATLERTTSDSTPAFRFFEITMNGHLSLQNIILQNGFAADEVTYLCDFGGCEPASYGGAIFNRFGTLNLSQVQLLNNEALGRGGAIYQIYGYLDIQDSYLAYNYTHLWGGAISYYAADVAYMEELSEAYNFELDPLIPQMNATPTLNIENTIITGNHADSGGAGAFINLEGMVFATFIQVDITENKAALRGAGLSIYGTGKLEITDSTISNNIQKKPSEQDKPSIGSAGGGGISVNLNDFVIKDTVIAGNQTTGYGGAISVGGGRTTLNNVSIHNNQAGSGGAIYIDWSVLNPVSRKFVAVFIENSTITANSARENGGGIAYIKGELTLENTSVIDNQAPLDADIFYSEAVQIPLESS